MGCLVWPVRLEWLVAMYCLEWYLEVCLAGYLEWLAFQGL
jgi:hypothetical protein